MKKIIVEIEGMNCGGCVNKIKNHFKSNSGIITLEVSLEEKKVEISGEDSLSNMTIRNELIELGFIVNSIKKV